VVKKYKEKRFAAIKFFKHSRKTVPVGDYKANCKINNEYYSIKIFDIPAGLEFEDFATVRVQLLLGSQELPKGKIFVTEGLHVVGVCNIV
jgi:hypothetical protein